MGLLCEIFSREYGEIFYADLNGQEIYISPFENGASATVFHSLTDIPSCELDEQSDMREWADYAFGANTAIVQQLEPHLDQVFDANREIGHLRSPELIEALGGAHIDIINPNYSDVYWTDFAAQEIGQIAARQALDVADSDPEQAAVMAAIASDMTIVREGLQEIMDMPQFNAMIAVQDQLRDMGATPEQIYTLNVAPYDQAPEPQQIQPQSPQIDLSQP